MMNAGPVSCGEPRRLRSNAQRALLYYAQHGRCARCGALLMEHWHADHIIPWSVRPRTNVHEMQAMCPSCNAKKGAKLMLDALYTHQRQVAQDLDSIRAGELPQRHLIAHCTPGGGKTLLGLLAALKLRPSIIDKLCWVVPRLTLLEQAAEVFLDARWRELFGHRLELREAGNEYDPSRGKTGYVVTYQALTQDGAQIHLKEFQRYRYGLILDESHHVAVGSAYHRALEPLVQQAAFVMHITGLLERSDRRPIGFLPYVADERDQRVVRETTEESYYVEYGLEQALRERAIIPVYFTHLDGTARWLDNAGVEQTAPEFGENTDALWSALHTEYALALLDACIKDWQGHGRRNPRAKLLVVCATVKQGRWVLRHMRQQGLTVEMASYDDPTSAATIRRFRKGGLQAVVTVQMAYEGMDVPAITHLACLTHIRSAGWIYQMFGRIWRVDRGPGALSYEAQRALAFVPDDAEMQAVIKTITEARDRALLQREPSIDEPPSPSGLAGASTPRVILPLASAPTVSRASELIGEVLTPEQTRYYQDLISERRWEGFVTPVEMEELRQALDRRPPSAEAEAPPSPDGPPPLTARQREDRLRQEIDAYLKGYEFDQGVEWGSCSAQLLREGWSPRDRCREEELTRLWQHVQQRFPR